MKPTLLASLLVLSAVSLSRAASPELALVAAMKLTDAPNYTWASTVDDDARSYTINGQTDRTSDLSLVVMPVVGAVRRHAGTGTANSDNTSTIAFKGDQKLVIQVDAAWKTDSEIAAEAPLPSRLDEENAGPDIGNPNGRARRGGFPSSRTAAHRKRLPPYSNLQKTLSRPHEEIGIIVATASDLKMEEDIVAGTLSDTAAKLLLVHAGQDEITPVKAAGTFRFWIRDGSLIRYEVKLEGTLAVLSGGNRVELEVHQTALTDITQVGKTKFEVPDEAKKKLGV